MKRLFTVAHACVTTIVLGGCSDLAALLGDPPSTEGCTWAAAGRNPFFVLEPGYILTLSGRGGGGTLLDVVITVEDETRIVDGIETRVVTEQESKNGKLIEVSRNYFALCQPRGDVFYFGEEVDDYKDGKITGHHGEWLAGKDGARPGMAMPGDPKVGDAAYIEWAPGGAMDHFEVVALEDKVETPAGTFTGALKIKETNPLEPGKVEYKWYARDVGLLVDEGARLVSYQKR